jgi:hypothetical protein
MEMTRERTMWLVLFASVAIAGLVFRIAVIDEGFWYDEAVSASRYFSRSMRGIVTGAAHPNNHPLYSLSVNVLWKFSENEVTARIPSFVAWLMSIGLVLTLSKRLFSEAAGWVAAMLMVLSSWPLRFSIEARGYMMATALGLLAVYLVVVGLQDDRKGMLTLGAASLALASFAHLYALILVVPALAVWLGIKVRSRSDLYPTIRAFVRWSATAGGIVFLLYLPSRYLIRLGGFLVGQVEVSPFSLTQRRVFDWDYMSNLVGAQISGSDSLLGLLVVVVPWVVCLIVYRRDWPALGLAIAPIVAVGSAVVGNAVFYERFFVVIQPIVAILVGAGVVAAVSRVSRERWWVVGIVSTLFVVGATLGPRGGFPETFPMQTHGWDEAAEYVDESGLTVVANPIGAWSQVRDAMGYYLDERPADDPRQDIQPGEQVNYVRLLSGTAEPEVTVTVGDPIRFGHVHVFALTWTGEEFVPTEE